MKAPATTKHEVHPVTRFMRGSPVSKRERFLVFCLAANAALQLFDQNRQYFCASGSLLTGSQVRCTPSAVTRYVSESTSIFGVASFSFISFFVSPRHFN